MIEINFPEKFPNFSLNQTSGFNDENVFRHKNVAFNWRLKTHFLFITIKQSVIIQEYNTPNRKFKYTVPIYKERP